MVQLTGRSNSGIQSKPFLYNNNRPPLMSQRDSSRGTFEKGNQRHHKKYLQRLGNDYALMLSDNPSSQTNSMLVTNRASQ